MAEKILQTRLLLKYDTYANWTSENPTLKAGEMAVATVPTGATTTPTMTNLPNIVLKVGDGSTPYNDLKFVSALAADVHGWAKAATKPEYVAADFAWLEQYVKDVANSEIKDTNTKYTIIPVEGSTYKFTLRSKELDGDWKDAATIDLTDVGTRLTNLETKVGSDTVANQIATAIDGLNKDAVTANQGEIISSVSESKGVINVSKRALVAADIPVIEQGQVNGLGTALAGKETAGAAAQALTDAKAHTSEAIAALNFTDPGYTAGQFVTKVEQSNGVITKITRANVGISNVTGLETRLSDIEGDIEGLETSKQDVIDWDDNSEYSATNKAATLGSITNAINALDYAGGAADTNKFVTKVTQKDGVVAAEYAQPTIANINGLTTRLSGIDTEVAKKQDQLTFVGANGAVTTPNASDNRVATEKFVISSVADLTGAMHFKGVYESKPTDLTQFKSGDVILVGYDEYVFDGSSSKWVALGNESIYQTKELATQQHNAITKQVTDLESKHDSEMAALEKKHDDAVTSLQGSITTAINALDGTVTGTGPAIKTLSQTDGVLVAELRALTKADIPTIDQSQVNGLGTALAGKETAGAAATALSDAKAYTDEEIETAVGALTYTDPNAATGKFVTKVTQANGVIAVTHAALTKTDIPTIDQSQVSGLATALAGKETAGAAATALTNAKKYTDDEIVEAIAALDSSITQETNKVVAGFSIKDGVIDASSVKKTTLAAIATTGNVNDLIQTSGDVLVFNCGSATVNI